MNPMDFRFPLDEEQMTRRKQNLERLKAEPRIQQLLSAQHLDESVLERHSSLFERWLRNSQTCRMCLGLEFCAMKVKGHEIALHADADGFLEEVYVPCAYQQEKSEQTAHQKNYVVSHLNEDDYTIDMNWIMRSMAHGAAVDYVQAAAAMSQSLTTEYGVILFGTPGSGKSTLLMAAANEYAKKGTRTAFVRVPLLVAELKENLKDDEYRRRVLNSLRFAPVLFLDDFGSELCTPWVRDEILFPLLDARMNNHLKTYFSSNSSMADLERHFAFRQEDNDPMPAKRLLDRVRSMAKEVKLLGGSRRVSPQ